MAKIVLIDGNSILNRAFYGIPDLTNSKGMHTNAVYGFLNIMFKILDEETPDYLVVAFDVKHPTFRHEMYSEYKGTRKPMPENLVEQLPLIRKVLGSMNICIVERPGYEADDILGTLAIMGEKEDNEVSLISGDRDLLQIATDKIKIRIPKTIKGKTVIEDYNTNDVIEKYGVTPKQIIDLKGLMGDASDNIPGVYGIGEKTAVKILKEYPSVELAVENADKIMPKKAAQSIAENKEIALLSKKLATIKTDCELEISYKDAPVKDMFNEKSVELFRELEFKSILERASVDVKSSNPVDGIISVEDFNGALSTFEKMEKASDCGISIASFNDKWIVAVTFDEDCVHVMETEGFLTDAYIEGQINEYLKKGGALSVNDLKPFLKNVYIDIDYKTFDVAIAAYLLNPIADSYSYDYLGVNYLNVFLPSEKELFGKNAKKMDESEKRDIYIKMCAYDSYVAFRTRHFLEKKLEEENMSSLYYDIEFPLIYTLYDMQNRGIKVDANALKEYSNMLAEGIQRLEGEIYELAGEEFNINSPKQLGVILFEKLNLPFAKKTKTGYSTSADIMEKLMCEHPIVGKVLEYRQLTKLKSTYADGLSEYIQDDNRIHSTFNQTITMTGRISSTEPNLQNIPIRFELGRQIRKVFIPQDDYVFLDADYSQIELRMLAHLSEDEALIEAYNSDEDIHKITASKVFNTPLDEVTPLQRRNAKAVNFGIVYGISSFGLGQDLGITRAQAQEYIKSYFKTYPKIKSYLDGLVESAKEKGYSLTMYGRKRPIPELSSSNFMQRQFGERVAMNAPIQGSAADIIKIAMIRVNDRLKQMGLKSRLLLQIHDELLVETHKSEVDTVKEILVNEMKNVAKLRVSLEVDAGMGCNWYEAH